MKKSLLLSFSHVPEHTVFRSVFRVVLLLVISSVVLPGCGKKLNLQLFDDVKILGFDYVIRTYPNANALSQALSSVQNGNQTVLNVISTNSGCKFLADFSDKLGNHVPPLRPATIRVSGTPGQVGFNITISSPTKLLNADISNSSGCSVVSYVVINIGRITEALAVGGSTDYTKGTVEFADGTRFETSEFFRAYLDGFNDITRRTTGRFQFVNSLPGSHTLLFVDGAFALEP